MFPAIFLDRDGVLIENVDQYVRSWDDVVVFPGALAALSRLINKRWKLIVVTNQSVVGRGIISEEAAEQINARLLRVIQQAGGRIDGVYMCVHAPQVACSCRKPKPGLVLRAAAEHQIDLSHSLMVGDALSDVEAGQSAGIPVNVLVRTGRGHKQEKLQEAKSLQPFLVYDCLEDAVNDLLTGLLSKD
jgi:D-glycero-D-manno-heptose 1,7-bisphosphate phosphatase